MPHRPVVLLQPPGLCRQFTRSGSLYPPLGLCHLAATVPSERVEVLDAEGLGWTESRTLAEVQARQPVAVGLTATSFTLDIVEHYAAAFRADGIRTITGGPHASLEPIDLLGRCPSVDVAVRGEGETVFPALVERLMAGRAVLDLPGVCGRTSDGGIHLTPTILQVGDFGPLPFARLEGLPINSYWCPDARRRPLTTFMMTRGCPHRCAFCSSPNLMGRKVRGYSVGRCVDELERIAASFGVREVSFVDDVFTINRRRALQLCAGLIERRLELSWFCNARADQITPELAAAMARAGCHQVYLGFESGSQEILDRIRKGATVEQLVRGADLLRAAGIGRSIGFVIGLPGESDETVDATIALAQRVRPERIQFTRFTALPGTELARAGASSRGFHNRHADRVSDWVERCYRACADAADWGRESW